MPHIAIFFGVSLCGLTVVGMISSVEKLAALCVPMLLGLPILFAGVVALNPHRRMAWMRFAAVLALLGVLSLAGSLSERLTAYLNEQPINLISVWLLAATFGLMLLFLFFWATNRWWFRPGSLKPDPSLKFDQAGGQEFVKPTPNPVFQSALKKPSPPESFDQPEVASRP